MITVSSPFASTAGRTSPWSSVAGDHAMPEVQVFPSHLGRFGVRIRLDRAGLRPRATRRRWPPRRTRPDRPGLPGGRQRGQRRRAADLAAAAEADAVAEAQVPVAEAEQGDPVALAALQGGARNRDVVPPERRQAGARALGQQRSGMAVVVAVEPDDQGRGRVADVDVDGDLAHAARCARGRREASAVPAETESATGWTVAVPSSNERAGGGPATVNDRVAGDGPCCPRRPSSARPPRGRRRSGRPGSTGSCSRSTGRSRPGTRRPGCSPRR